MLEFIEANNFRNFSNFSLKPVPRFNLIFGENGSGKSSILESIYFLSLARSFRTYLTNPVISHNMPFSTLFGTLNFNHLKTSIGIKKTLNDSMEIRINGEVSKAAITLAKLLPVILINPDSYQLIHGGPSLRRQFMNWGTFHMEHSFIAVWKNFQRCLKQRNAALKMGLSQKEIQLWDNEFVELSLALDTIYLAYVEKLIPELQRILSILIDLEGLSVEYYSGWERNEILGNCLKESFLKERQQKRTLFGAHRADLKIYFKGFFAHEILSRGEQKLLIFAMQLAQASLLNNSSGRKVIYLIDDVAAELDISHRKKIVDFLTSLDSQVFLTCLESEQLATDLPVNTSKMFHVEHGNIKEEN